MHVVRGREMGREKMALLNLLMLAVRFARYVRDTFVFVFDENYQICTTGQICII